ncbi:IS3 family transposase [Clostridium tepidiprofundi]|uniref:IS3 family transposase n=1 Tax=Clostridium tepidiprofundi TaxID=420412 RepID=UPI0009FF1584
MKFTSLENLKEKIMKFIEFYYNRIYQKKLGCLTPIKYQNQPPISAGTLIRLPVYLTYTDSF